MSNNITLSVEDALTNIDNALAQLNANRQAHDILKASVERLRSEIIDLNGRLLTQSTEVQTLYTSRIFELERQIEELENRPIPAADPIVDVIETEKG